MATVSAFSKRSWASSSWLCIRCTLSSESACPNLARSLAVFLHKSSCCSSKSNKSTSYTLWMRYVLVLSLCIAVLASVRSIDENAGTTFSTSTAFSFALLPAPAASTADLVARCYFLANETPAKYLAAFLHSQCSRKSDLVRLLCLPPDKSALFRIMCVSEAFHTSITLSLSTSFPFS